MIPRARGWWLVAALCLVAAAPVLAATDPAKVTAVGRAIDDADADWAVGLVRAAGTIGTAEFAADPAGAELAALGLVAAAESIVRVDDTPAPRRAAILAGLPPQSPLRAELGLLDLVTAGAALRDALGDAQSRQMSEADIAGIVPGTAKSDAALQAALSAATARVPPAFRARIAAHIQALRAFIATAPPVPALRARIEIATTAYAAGDYAVAADEVAAVAAGAASGSPRQRLIAVSAAGIALLVAAERKDPAAAAAAYARGIAAAEAIGRPRHAAVIDLHETAATVFAQLNQREPTLAAAKAALACWQAGCLGPPISLGYYDIAAALAAVDAKDEAEAAARAGLVIDARTGPIGEAVYGLVDFNLITAPTAFRAELLEKLLDGPAALVKPDDATRAKLEVQLADLYRELGKGEQAQALRARLLTAPLGRFATVALAAAAGAPSLAKAEAIEAARGSSELDDDPGGAVAVSRRAYEIRRAIEPATSDKTQLALAILAGNLNRANQRGEARSLYADYVRDVLADPKRDHEKTVLAIMSYQSFLEEIGAAEEASAQAPVIAEERARNYAEKGRRELAEKGSGFQLDVEMGLAALQASGLNDEAKALASREAEVVAQLLAGKADLASYKVADAVGRSIGHLLTLGQVDAAALLADDYLSRRLRAGSRFASTLELNPTEVGALGEKAKQTEFAVASRALATVVAEGLSDTLCPLFAARLPRSHATVGCSRIAPKLATPAAPTKAPAVKVTAEAPAGAIARLGALDRNRAIEAAAAKPNPLALADIDLERIALIEKLGAPGDGWAPAMQVVGDLDRADLRETREYTDALLFAVEHMPATERQRMEALVAAQRRTAPSESLAAGRASALAALLALSDAPVRLEVAVPAVTQALRNRALQAASPPYALSPTGLLGALSTAVSNRPASALVALAPQVAPLLAASADPREDQPGVRLTAELVGAMIYRAAGDDDAAAPLVQSIAMANPSDTGNVAALIGLSLGASMARAADVLREEQPQIAPKPGMPADYNAWRKAFGRLIGVGAWREAAGIARRFEAPGQAPRYLIMPNLPPLVNAAHEIAAACAGIARSAEARLLYSQKACDAETIALTADAIPTSLRPIDDLAVVERALAGRLGGAGARLDALAAEASLARSPPALAAFGARLRVPPAPPSLAALRASLRPDEALILLDLQAALIIRRDRVVLHPLDANEEEVRGNLRRLGADLDPAGLRDGVASAVDLRALRALWVRLFGPVEPDLAGIARVRVAAEGLLALTPFEALLTEDPPTDSWTVDDKAEPAWAIRRFAFSLLPTGGAQAALAALPRSGAADMLLGLGGPLLRDGGPPAASVESLLGSDGRIDPRRLEGLPALPDTVDELKKMAAAVGRDRSKMITDVDLDEDRLRTIDWARYRIVAIATHGFVAASATTRPAQLLVLSPPPSATPSNDGALTDAEIGALRLDADLVILSACDTGVLPEGSGSSGLVGLADRFLESGARTVVISRWPVVSATAERLTVPMVRAAAAAGPGRIADGLREAILASLQAPPAPLFRHPMFWATFAVVGDVASAAAGR